MTTILYFLLAIGILVFVHEMGHYLAARQCGVQVLRFSIGFGKELVKRTGRKTGIEWVIAAIPLGGYVKMNDASFESKGLAARAWIVFAGPLANLIFAVLAYSVLFSTEREEPVAVIAQPVQDTPAATAGLRGGDRIVAVDGQAVTSFTDVRWRMAQRVVGDGARETRLQIDRQGQQLDLSIKTTVTPTEDAADPARVIAAMGLAPFSASVKVIRVQDDSAAAAAGMRAGDRIVKVNGEAMTQPDRVIRTIQQSQGRPLELIVDDGSGMERVMVTAKAGNDGVYRIGAVVGGEVATVSVSDDPITAAWKGVIRTWEMTGLTFKALGRMVVGELSWRQISGPVTIADAAGQSASNGLKAFIGFLALISISIAVLNLLPIPMLDGGHLMYYLWELIRGSPLPAEVQEAGRRLGVALIIMLTVVALFNDFARLAGL